MLINILRQAPHKPRPLHYSAAISLLGLSDGPWQSTEAFSPQESRILAVALPSVADEPARDLVSCRLDLASALSVLGRSRDCTLEVAKAPLKRTYIRQAVVSCLQSFDYWRSCSYFRGPWICNL